MPPGPGTPTMNIACYGDSITQGIPGASYFDALRRKLPDHTLINYGKGGDTALSLYQRVRRYNLLQPVDVAFVFVGVNDVLVHLTPTGPMLKTVFGQPWAEDLDAFRSQYAGLLALIGEAAGRVIAASPLLIGEDLNSKWNQRLAEVIAVTREEAERAGTDYVDLRARAAALLDGKPISPYLPTSHWRTLLDGLTLLTDDQIRRMAARRGLHLTLDGVHLNPTGAEMVAEAFAAALARE